MTKVQIKHSPHKDFTHMFDIDVVLSMLDRPCFNVAWERAKDTASKKNILDSADKLYAEIKARGDDYCIELCRAILLNNMQASDFTCTEIDTIATVFEIFETNWDIQCQCLECKKPFPNSVAIYVGRCPNCGSEYIRRNKKAQSKEDFELECLSEQGKAESESHD